jgi:hypothetical protein
MNTEEHITHPQTNKYRKISKLAQLLCRSYVWMFVSWVFVHWGPSVLCNYFHKVNVVLRKILSFYKNMMSYTKTVLIIRCEFQVLKFHIYLIPAFPQCLWKLLMYGQWTHRLLKVVQKHIHYNELIFTEGILFHH